MNISINNGDYVLTINHLEWTGDGYHLFGGKSKTTAAEEAETIFNLVWVDIIGSVSIYLKTPATEMYNMLKDSMLYEANRLFEAGRYESFMDYAIIVNTSVSYLWKKMKMSENYKEEDDSSNKFVF